MSYLSVQNIVKNFGQIQALKGVSLDIEKGEFVTLLGPSGCGKSTLLRIIAGLEFADDGKLLIDGRNMSATPVNKRNLGMVFQNYSLFPNMTVTKNVAFGLQLKKLSNDIVAKKVNGILELVGLSEKSKAYPDELSGGQQQRVALARALVVQPDVLLLDEPLSALDAKIRLSLRRLIRDIQLKLKITTIFVTHDQEEALSISDRIFVMEAGTIAQYGSPEQIYKEPKTKFVAGFLGAFNFLDASFVGASEGKTLVRPEHISIAENGSLPNTDIYSGCIKNVCFLGNISRLEVMVDKKPVLVDVLNNDNCHYEGGQTILLHIPQEKYITL